MEIMPHNHNLKYQKGDEFMWIFIWMLYGILMFLLGATINKIINEIRREEET